MELNYGAIIVATVFQFICGAIWYTYFGAVWGKIHGFDKLSKDVQEKMMKSMGPLYATQFFVTFITTCILALFISALPQDWNAYGIAGFFWLGFIVPTQISGVIFGGTENKWVVKKIAIQAGASLLCIQIAAAVLHLM